MKQPFAKVVESVDRLSLRERLFVFAAGLFIVGGLWEAVLAAPLSAREGIANDKVGLLQERLLALDDALTTTAAGISEGVPNQLEQLRALRERVAAGDEELRVFTTDVVDPVQMRLVLEELLRRQDGLTLVSAVNLPAVALVEDEETEQGEPAQTDGSRTSDAPRLYRHSLVLTLNGNYLDCLRYLEAVERLPWHLYWTRLDFSVDEYPNNDVVLELTTLSLDEEWIGV
jgi:MSHA biogenesis protein MshJ